MTTTYEFSGRTVTMPVEVRQAAGATAMFDVDAAVAAEVVPDAFEVVETSPGRTNLSIACIDYVDNDLGDYLEVGIIFFVRPAGGSTDGSADGTYIWKLPVDQQFTRDAGEGIWGFPKTVETIRVDPAADEGSLRWRLEMDEEHVLTITVPTGGADDLPVMEMTTYTLIDGAPHATPFGQGGPESAVRLGADGVEIELGAHPISTELSRLGLPAPAIMSTWTGQMRGTFGEPVAL